MYPVRLTNRICEYETRVFSYNINGFTPPRYGTARNTGQAHGQQLDCSEQSPFLGRGVGQALCARVDNCIPSGMTLLVCARDLVLPPWFLGFGPSSYRSHSELLSEVRGTYAYQLGWLGG